MGADEEVGGDSGSHAAAVDAVVGCVHMGGVETHAGDDGGWWVENRKGRTSVLELRH